MQARKLSEAARVMVPIILFGLAGCATSSQYLISYNNEFGNAPKTERILKNANVENKKRYMNVTENLENPRAYFVNFTKGDKLNPWEIRDILHTIGESRYTSPPTLAYHAVYSVDGSFCEVDFLAFKDSKGTKDYIKRDMELLYSESKVEKLKGCKRCFRIADARHNALQWVSENKFIKIVWAKEMFEESDLSNLMKDFLEKYPPESKKNKK